MTSRFINLNEGIIEEGWRIKLSHIKIFEAFNVENKSGCKVGEKVEEENFDTNHDLRNKISLR
jgi:hypothetical protein